MMKRVRQILLKGLSVCLALLCLPVIPITVHAGGEVPNNAEVNVARGEEAFMKSNYDFTANWIWNPSDNGEGNRWMIFRKDLTVDEMPETVTARIAADTKYWLYINARLAVYEGGLKRGAALLKKDIYTKDDPSQPDLSAMLSEVATYYDEVDLTPYFKEGENTIVALVWYFGNEGHSHVGSGKGGFLFEAELGNRRVISDASWKTSRHLGYQPSAIVGGFAQEYHIVYDARRGFDSFADPDFDTSSWQNAKVLGKAGDKPWNELWKRSIPEWKVWDLETYAPDDTDYVTALSSGKYRLKLPSNIQFTPYIKVKAPAGKVIRMSSPNAGNTSVTYTTKGASDGGSAVQEFESLTWINWWYVDFEIPEGVEVLALGYRQSGYNTEFEGVFDSSDEFFDRLWIKARDTAYVNIRDTFMDCPDRERAPWLGDAVNEMAIAYYAMSPTVYDAVRKDIATRVNWQNADGIIPSTAPATFRYNEYAELTGQSLAGVMSWYDYYLWSGDIETLRMAYPALQKYMDTFDLDSVPYTDPFLRGDGTNTMHLNWIDWGPNMDQHLSLNIWAYIGVDTLCKFASALDDTENLAKYETLRDAMKSKFDAMFWNGKEYRSATYTGAPDDRGQALAVFAGLVSPDKYPVIRDLLMKHQYASPYTVKYVIEALYLMGYPADAEKRMKESYKNDVPLDDPTFSEGWGGTGSKNHGWAGGGLITLSGYAAGIRPLEANFKRYTVIPQLASIESLKATVPTAKGKITVDVKNTEDSFTLSVNILPGSTALVGIPRFASATKVVCGGKTLWENGYPVEKVNGVTFVSSDDQFIYFEASEGELTLSSMPADTPDKEAYTLEIPAWMGGKALVNGESVTLPYRQSFEKGSLVTVQAKADEGSLFYRFFGSIGSREETLTLTLDRDLLLEAEFVKDISLEGVFLEVSGFSQGGRLLVNGKPSVGHYRDLFETGVSVTLTAEADEDFRFVAWQDENGRVLSAEAVYTVTLTKNRKLTAVFVSMLGDNLARGKKATVSSTVDNHMFSADKLTDGIYTVTNQNEGWTSLETSPTQWLYIDLGAVKTLDTVKLYPRHNGTDNGYGIPLNLEILVSTDAKKWKTVARYTNLKRLETGAHTFSFEETEARYVKVNGSRLRENPYDGNRTRFQVSEIEIYHMAAYTKAKPTVLTEPCDSLVKSGAKVTFSLQAASAEDMRYQWYVSYQNKPFAALEGETSPTLTLTSSLDKSGACYYCEVTNLHGSTRSKTVCLTVVGDNLALRKKTTVSTSQTVGSYFHKDYLNDGIADTRPNVNEGWTSEENHGAPEWVTVDLGKLTKLSHVVLYPRYDGVNDGYGIPEKLTVLLSSDGTSYTEVLKLEKIARPTAGSLILALGEREARYIKVVGEGLRENPSDGNRKRMQLSEIEIYLASYPEQGDSVITTAPDTTANTPVTDAPVTDTPVTEPIEAPKSPSYGAWIAAGIAVAAALVGAAAFVLIKKKKK